MRTALITGVSRGLGFHICHVLKAAGYRVLGLGLSTSPRNAALDGYQVFDLATPTEKPLYESEEIELLVNNASVYLDDPRSGYGDALQLRMNDLRRTFEVNVFGAFLMILKWVPSMIARGSGRLINVSSGMGRLRDADGASFAYRSSKLALNSLTLTVSRRFMTQAGDLSAFSYCPGWIRTDMGSADAPHDAEAAAKCLVHLLRLPASESNGRFFRHRKELGWDIENAG